MTTSNAKKLLLILFLLLLSPEQTAFTKLQLWAAFETATKPHQPLPEESEGLVATWAYYYRS